MGIFQEVSNWVLGSYKVRTTQATDGAQYQHVRLDRGVGTAESQVALGTPLPVTPSSEYRVIDPILTPPLFDYWTVSAATGNQSFTCGAMPSNYVFPGDRVLFLDYFPGPGDPAPANIGQTRVIASVSGNTVTLASALPETIGLYNRFWLYRDHKILVDENGTANVAGVVEDVSLASGLFGLPAIAWDTTNAQATLIATDEFGAVYTNLVSGSVISTTQTGRSILANVTAAGATSPVTMSSNGAVYINIRGTYAGTTFTVEGEADSGTGAWITLPLTRIENPLVSESAIGPLTSTPRTWLVGGGSALTRIRLNVSAHTSGTANFVLIQAPTSSDAQVAAFQAGSWSLAANQSVNVAQMNGVAVTMGNGSSGTGVQRVTIADDSSGQIVAIGKTAHDATDTGNPVKVGARARTSNITAVSNDDRVDAIADRIARQLVLPYTLDENVFHAVSAADITNTTSTAVKTATASTRYWITAITVSNMSATVSTRVDILDGSTVIWTGPAALGGGGYSITFPTPRPLTTNTAINAQCATTGAAVRVAIAGYTGV